MKRAANRTKTVPQESGEIRAKKHTHTRYCKKKKCRHLTTRVRPSFARTLLNRKGQFRPEARSVLLLYSKIVLAWYVTRACVAATVHWTRDNIDSPNLKDVEVRVLVQALPELLHAVALPHHHRLRGLVAHAQDSPSRRCEEKKATKR